MWACWSWLLVLACTLGQHEGACGLAELEQKPQLRGPQAPVLELGAPLQQMKHRQTRPHAELAWHRGVSGLRRRLEARQQQWKARAPSLRWLLQKPQTRRPWQGSLDHRSVAGALPAAYTLCLCTRHVRGVLN